MGVDMESYAEQLKDFVFGQKGNKGKKRLLEPAEVSRYRGAVGALNGLRSQARPDLAGRTLMMRRGLAAPTVGHAMEVNNANVDARVHMDLEIFVLPIPVEEVIFAENDDAALQHDNENKS